MYNRETILGGLPFAISKGWASLCAAMPKRLKRLLGQGDLHFITFCCYQRRPLLATARVRTLAAKILGEVRRRFPFPLIGFVFMPEHVHLLIGESPSAMPPKIIQVFKQRLARRLRGRKRASEGQLSLGFVQDPALLGRFWQRRYYDFNVYSRAKVLEKLHYMHSNPVRERLVKHPGDWPWSSWCFYYRGHGLLAMDSWTAPAALPAEDSKERPTLCEKQNRKG